MAKVRTNVAGKWARRAGSATQEFTEGVQNPRQDWAQATVAAAANQAAAIQQAITEKRFEKGVAKAGTGRWQQKTLSKGSQRFASGVQEAELDYATAVQPYLEVAANTVLPPRGPKGDPKNFQRVITMANAMRAKKLGK